MRTGRAWLGAMTAAAGLLLAGCGTPDVKALHRMGCEQAAAAVDLQSVKQLDALRKGQTDLACTTLARHVGWIGKRKTAVKNADLRETYEIPG